MVSRTIEFYDDGRTWRNTVPNDSVIHSASPDKIVFSHVSPQDSVAYATSTDKIHYTRGQVMGSIQRRSAFKKVFVAPPPPPPPTYDEVVSADSPVARWKLDEITGTVANDSVGTNHGTYTGGYTLDQAGIPSTGRPSVLLNGTSGYIDLGAPASLNITAAWTLEAWVYLTSTPDGCAVISEQYTGGSNPVLYSLGFGNTTSGGGATLDGGYYTGSAWKKVTSGALSLNTWHHIACTWDGTTLRLYADGAQTAAGAQSPGPTAGINRLYIGKRHDNSESPFFPGRIDEVAIYSTALSEERLAAHYNAGI